MSGGRTQKWRDLPQCARLTRLTFFKNGAPIVEISIADICPVHCSVGIFRDSEDGVPARERVVKILRGFRLVELIPAVEMLESNSAPLIDTSSPTELTACIAHWLQASPAFRR